MPAISFIKCGMSEKELLFLEGDGTFWYSRIPKRPWLPERLFTDSSVVALQRVHHLFEQVGPAFVKGKTLLKFFFSDMVYVEYAAV